MIAISASEKAEIRKKFPNVFIVRTMKQDSKRHHYYMTEDASPMRLLCKLRGEDYAKYKRKDVDICY